MELYSNQFAKPMKYSFSVLIILKTLGLELLRLKMNSGQQILQNSDGIKLVFGLLVLMVLISIVLIESRHLKTSRLLGMILDLSSYSNIHLLKNLHSSKNTTDIVLM